MMMMMMMMMIMMKRMQAHVEAEAVMNDVYRGNEPS